MALPAFFDPIVNLPARAKMGLGIVVLVAIVAVPWYFLVSPVQEQVTKLEGDLNKVEVEVAQQRAILAQLDSFRKQSAELEGKLVLLTQKLPTEREMPPLYRTVNDTAFQSGLGVMLFQPREARIRDY